MIIILSIVGGIVQYTSLGDISGSKQVDIRLDYFENEKASGSFGDFSQKQISNRVVYIKLMGQIDRLLVNKKKIWGLILLCFSLPRNTFILFYDTDNMNKLGFMRFLKVLGFVWSSFFTVYVVGFRSYVLNANDYQQISTSVMGTLLMEGSIYGFAII